MYAIDHSQEHGVKAFAERHIIARQSAELAVGERHAFQQLLVLSCDDRLRVFDAAEALFDAARQRGVCTRQTGQLRGGRQEAGALLRRELRQMRLRQRSGLQKLLYVQCT